MPIEMTVNGSSPGFLLAPNGPAVFPAILNLRSETPNPVDVELQVSNAGAGIVVPQGTVRVTDSGVDVVIHSTSLSNSRNDTSVMAMVGGVMEGTIGITSIEQPQLWFDGRFETRFATGNDPYNHPRGDAGWMWSLEGEPDFVPADSVPDRIEKPVGRELRFQNPVALRPHVPPIGVFVRAIQGSTATGVERFEAGDPVIGVPVELGPHTYFASNRLVSTADRNAGALPEESHMDGHQPLALFQFKLSNLFSGESQTGPFVPGTVESSNPRTPDSRPRASGLTPLSFGEINAFPFPSPRAFAEQRVALLLPDFVALKNSGQTNTVEFRNLRTRIGHLLLDLSSAQRSQILNDHQDVGMAVLSRNASFAWGNREIYRGMIDKSVSVTAGVSPFLDYLSGFTSIHFLSVFFNFHTDEACAHVYGAIDPVGSPQTL